MVLMTLPVTVPMASMANSAKLRQTNVPMTPVIRERVQYVPYVLSSSIDHAFRISSTATLANATLVTLVTTVILTSMNALPIHVTKATAL